MRACNILRALAVCTAIGAIVPETAYAADRDESRPLGRWIFRYDRSGEQPPLGRAQPELLGTITEAVEARGRQWAMRVRVEALDGRQRTLTVTESTRVDGRPAKQAAETLVKGVAVAVFGEEVRGEFRASALFVIPEAQWREIVADAQGVAGSGLGAESAGLRLRPQWPGEADEQDADASAFPWPARSWEPRYPIPEVPARAPARRPPTATAMERARRADLSGTIRSVRFGGRELSVATAAAVVVVLLEEQTILRRDGRSIAAAELREGDVVDVSVARWRGAESCIAKQLWVVTQEAVEAPLSEP